MPVGVLLNTDFGQYDPVRAPQGRLLEKMAVAMLNKALSPPREIRGVVMAADTLLGAIVDRGQEAYVLFVHPSGGRPPADRYQRMAARQPARVTISSTEEIVTGGADRHRLSAWFNPAPYAAFGGGGAEISFRARAAYSSRPYPITTLLHGLSSQHLLYACYLRFLLEGALPCDSLICTSRASRDAVLKILDRLSEWLRAEVAADVKYRGRLDLLPLCVNTSELRPQEKPPLRRLLRLPHDAFVLLLLGRLSPLKADLFPYLQVFASLVRRNPTRRLFWVIAGTEDPGYTALLKGYARELGVLENLRIMLNVSDKTKSMLMPAANVFLSPSDTPQESFGLAPVEAMACGVPQIVPDWNGYRDTVSHGETGFLIPTRWMDCLSDLGAGGLVAGWEYDHLCIGQSVAADMGKALEYLQALVQNDQLRNEMAERSRARALSIYSFDAVAVRYEELRAELARAARPLKIQPALAKSDRWLYYEFFGHYASCALHDRTPVRITPAGIRAAAADGLPLGNLDTLSSRNILDRRVIREVLSSLADEGAGVQQTRDGEAITDGGAVPLGELIESLGKKWGNRPDYLRRHVMWLMKYGWLTTST